MKAALGKIRRALPWLAFALVLANWVYLALARPNIQWTGQFATQPEIMQYLLFVAVVGCLIIYLIPRNRPRDWGLIAGAVIFDIVLGQLMLNFPVPLYLETFGVVAVGVLLGSVAGSATAGLATLILYPLAPAMLPLAIVNMTVGFLAGQYTTFGGFVNWFTTVLSGIFTGVVSALLATPIALYFLGTMFTGVEQAVDGAVNYLIAALVGWPIAGRVPSDIVDKTVVILLVTGVIRFLYKRGKLQSYPRANFQTLPSKH